MVRLVFLFNNRFLKAVTVWCFCFLFCCIADGRADIILIKDHQPRSVIVLPKKATPAETYAAHQLRLYLAKMTGCYLPVYTDDMPLEGKWRFWLGNLEVTAADDTDAPSSGTIISIGRTVYAEQSRIHVNAEIPDAYRITDQDGVLYLLGKGDRGQIYAVYGFLEDYLGCRWLLPGELGESIPETGTVQFPSMDDTQIPSFDVRMQVGVGSYPPYTDWHIKNRMHLRAEADDIFLRQYNLSIKGIVTHAFDTILPGYKFNNDHPEYFSLQREEVHWNDARAPAERTAQLLTPAKTGPRGQICTTNPEGIGRTVTWTRHVLDKNPGTDFISLCPNDVPLFCLCDRCKALDVPGEFYARDGWVARVPGLELVSDRLWTYFNAVAEAFPERQFYVLAYHNYVNPPQRVKPRSNVMTGICHMSPACSAHPFNDPDCSENLKFNAILKDWTALHDNFMLYAYTSRPIWEQLPFPIARQYAANIQYIHELGIRRFYSQAVAPGRWGQLGTHLYVIAKMLWDVNRDPEKILDDYFEKLYEESAPMMSAYYDLLETSMSAPGVYVKFTPEKEARSFLTPAVLRQGNDLLRSAEAAALSDINSDRIRPVRIAHDYTMLYLQAMELGQEYDTTKERQTLEACIKAYERLIRFCRDNARYDSIVYFGGARDIYSFIENNPREHYLFRKNQLQTLDQ